MFEFNVFGLCLFLQIMMIVTEKNSDDLVTVSQSVADLNDIDIVAVGFGSDVDQVGDTAILRLFYFLQ